MLRKFQIIYPKIILSPVVTAEKAESFVNANLEFKSLNLFDKELSVEDKEIHLQEFINNLYESVDLESFDVIHTHYWLSGLVGKEDCK